MEKGTHGRDEKRFEELSYADQAKTLNAQIQIIKKGLNAHFKKALESKDLNFIESSKGKYIAQLNKIIKQLEKDTISKV
ncbi:MULTISPECIES: hypothetical protein [Flavobacterium]|uniref:hypothetical protein n=1 Tax=Flavobacterium TaxID=237 RepID=UPI0011820DD6|nr:MULTISPECIES: hypothetical protein [Flavobacterium]MCR4030433.1 hypothetical protein [Flavobacterium panacis]